MTDDARARELAEERFGPPALDEDQVLLLAVVHTGRVRRYRRNSVTTIRGGGDCFGRASLDYAGRLLRPQLEVLERRGLVVLPVPPEANQAGGPASWTWELTKAGSKALARAAPRRRRTT